MENILRPYFSIPGYIWLWMFTVISISLFSYRLTYFIKIFRLAKSENRFRNVLERLKHVAIDVFLEPRFNDRQKLVNRIVWPVHMLIFWGFLVYAGSFGFSLLKGLFPFLPYPMPDSLPFVNFLLETFGVLVLVALCIAAYRRFIIKPPGVKQSMDAAIILTLIFLVMLTSILSSAFLSAGAAHEASAWQPLSAMMGHWFSNAGMAQVTAHRLHLAMWWGHFVIVLGFLAYLPFSKHFHLLASPFNVYLLNLQPKGALPREETTADVPATFDLRDFTWKDLLGAMSCAECGRCDRCCPGFECATGLSPQNVVHYLKQHVLEAGPVLLKGGSQSDFTPLIDGLINRDEIWGCTTCYSCMAHCPVRNEHVNIINRLRRHVVSKGEVETHLQDTLMGLSRYGNSFAQSDRARAKWTQGLDFKIKDARKEPVEYLWFVGDYASYDSRLQGITRTVANIFNAAGLDFGIMYEGERNAGNDVRRVGEEGLYEMLVEKNLASIERCQFKEIVTTDPHTLNTLKNEYPDFGGKFTVKHYSELIHDLIGNGKLRLKTNGKTRVTYHDPCYLGRYNDIYDEPREIIEAIGMELVEMPRNREDGYCCGAGGGHIWMEDKPGCMERPSEHRVREAVALKEVQTLVTSCPKDIVMFQDALKTTGNENMLRVKDIAELVWDAVEQPEKEN
jgi:Fe-S oxidoreductase/nitrate reductase gamma subunit